MRSHWRCRRPGSRAEVALGIYTALLQSGRARLDANLPVQSLKTMTQQVKENIFIDRMVSTLSAATASAEVISTIKSQGFTGRVVVVKDLDRY